MREGGKEREENREERGRVRKGGREREEWKGGIEKEPSRGGREREEWKGRRVRERGIERTKRERERGMERRKRVREGGISNGILNIQFGHFMVLVKAAHPMGLVL